MVAVREALTKAAAVDVRIVLCGETGTGRLHAARYVHALGAVPGAPFVRLAVHDPRTLERLSDPRLGEAVAGGTVVLEAADEASPEMQGYLTAAVEAWTGSGEEGSHPARVVATTCRDLLGLVENGLFRKDLHYLLDVFPIAFPPLRHRLEEVPAYLEHFHRQMAPGKRVPPLTSKFLEVAFAHTWPGNLRELANLVASSVTRTGGHEWALPRIHPRRDALEFPSFQQAKREFEAGYVRRVLLLTGGNVSRAADLAEKARKDFYALLSRNGIEPGEFRR
jgi:two-component system response regulator GlrR